MGLAYAFGRRGSSNRKFRLKPGPGFALDASSYAENVLPRFKERTCERASDILFFEEKR